MSREYSNPDSGSRECGTQIIHMSVPPLKNNRVHIADKEFVVSELAGESPLCSICRQVLGILSTEIKDVTCIVPIQIRAHGGCHLCLLVLHRFEDTRYSSVAPRIAPSFVVRYRKTPNFVVQVTRFLNDANSGNGNQAEAPSWLGQDTSIVAVRSKGAFPETKFFQKSSLTCIRYLI
jgi:hypothetical protein